MVLIYNWAARESLRKYECAARLERFGTHNAVERIGLQVAVINGDLPHAHLGSGA
jgi:hypothetical protein